VGDVDLCLWGEAWGGGESRGFLGAVDHCGLLVLSGYSRWLSTTRQSKELRLYEEVGEQAIICMMS
jgi:hypothetical protein